MVKAVAAPARVIHRRRVRSWLPGNNADGGDVFMVWLGVVGFPVSFDGVRHECIQGQPEEQGKQETTAAYRQVFGIDDTSCGGASSGSPIISGRRVTPPSEHGIWAPEFAI